MARNVYLNKRSHLFIGILNMTKKIDADLTPTFCYNTIYTLHVDPKASFIKIKPY